MYAQVTKLLGNGMCHVICIDNKTRLCHIRGKFRGRGKRDNTVENGTWLLVGLREWETEKKSGDKLENCDLLEVYSEFDKKRLKESIIIDWSIFILNDNKYAMISDECTDSFEFTNETTNEYVELMKQLSNDASAKQSIQIDEEQVDVDDI